MQKDNIKQSEKLLLDYIFGLLDKDQNNKVEDLLDHDDELAERVDGMMNFCLHNKIKNKEDYYKQSELELQAIKSHLLEKANIRQNKSPIIRKSRAIWITTVILLLTSTILWVYWNSHIKIKASESKYMLEQIRLRHGDRLVTAGPETNWTIAFKNGAFQKARELIVSPNNIQSTAEQFIAAGLFLYTQPSDAKQALALLQKNTAEVDYPQHAAVAYYLLDDYTSLVELAKKHPEIWRQLPASLNERIQKDPKILEQYRQ